MSLGFGIDNASVDADFESFHVNEVLYRIKVKGKAVHY
jgi:hypothetical protein